MIYNISATYIVILIIINLFFFLPVLTVFFHWNAVIVFCLALIFILLIYLSLIVYIETKKTREKTLKNVIKLNHINEECPICFTDTANYTGSCGHNLCYKCWERVLSIKKECPICRAQIIFV